MKKLLYLLIMIPFFLLGCDENDESSQDEDDRIVMIGDEPMPVEATCQDNIKNQDEEDIDCGGVCEPCEVAPEPVIMDFEEGDYRGVWSSQASNGSDFSGLNVTARITKLSDTEYVGDLFISSNFSSCCNTPGGNGDGVMTITIIDGAVTFKWDSEIPNCNGVFNATGTYTEANKITLNNLTGADCDGDHTGSLEFFK